MSQTQIFIETSVYEKTKHIAERKGMSVSDYVSAMLEKNTETPGKGHAMKYFGVLKDEPFEVPEDTPESWTPRESL